MLLVGGRRPIQRPGLLAKARPRWHHGPPPQPAARSGARKLSSSNHQGSPTDDALQEVVAGLFRAIQHRTLDEGELREQTALLHSLGGLAGAGELALRITPPPEHDGAIWAEHIRRISMMQSNPDEFDGLDFMSLGSHCATSMLLKKNRLKRFSGPFDWIFSNPAMVRHCLRDRFETYLQPKFHRAGMRTNADGRQERVAEHLLYQEQFGVLRPVFNHRDITLPAEMAYHRRAVERFLAMIDAGRPLQFIMCIYADSFSAAQRLDEFHQTAALLDEIAPATSLALFSVGMRELVMPAAWPVAVAGRHGLFDLDAVSVLGALHFHEMVDEIALLRGLRSHLRRITAPPSPLIAPQPGLPTTEAAGPISGDTVTAATPTTPEMVRWAFHCILGHEQVTELTVAHHRALLPHFGALCEALKDSSEFALRYGPRGYRPLLRQAELALLDELAIRPGQPRAGFYLDFLGVQTRVSHQPPGHGWLDGAYLGPPTTDRLRLHDHQEWGGLLRAAIDARQTGRFVVVELGAGWGPWVSAGARLAVLLGLEPALTAVEADAGHLDFLRSHFADNDLPIERCRLVQAAAGAADGTAARRDRVDGAMLEVPCISLETLLADESRIDLLHSDIQGSELEIMAAAIDVLNAKVRRIVIGTHGRSIEDGLFHLFTASGWLLEDDLACRMRPDHRPGDPSMLEARGVQVWVNLSLGS